MSAVVVGELGKEEQIILKDLIDELQGAAIGDRIWNEHKSWPMYSKFFDNMGPLPHHIHHNDEHAALIGQKGKPEAYYFPPQLNNHGGDFPYTFFGIAPGTTKEQIKECLKNFNKGDNKITSYSQAFKLDPGTGWDVPPGMLHAPGSMCTYEPQKASDVFAMYQSLVNEAIIPEELLWNGTPKDRIGDYDVQLTEEFLRAISHNAGITLHVTVPYGRNSHHVCEAIFKGLARALYHAITVTSRKAGIPSTKGMI